MGVELDTSFHSVPAWHCLVEVQVEDWMKCTACSNQLEEQYRHSATTDRIVGSDMGVYFLQSQFPYRF